MTGYIVDFLLVFFTRQLSWLLVCFLCMACPSEKGCILNGKNCSQNRPLFTRKANQVLQLPPLKVYPLPLTSLFLWHCLNSKTNVWDAFKFWHWYCIDNTHLEHIGYAMGKCIIGRMQTHILHILTAWSGLSLFANIIIGYTVSMQNKCPDEILHMGRMMWIHTYCACSKLLFRMTWSILFQTICIKDSMAA